MQCICNCLIQWDALRTQIKCGRPETLAELVQLILSYLLGVHRIQNFRIRILRCRIWPDPDPERKDPDPSSVITRLYQTGKEVLINTCQLGVHGETVFQVQKRWKHLWSKSGYCQQQEKNFYFFITIWSVWTKTLDLLSKVLHCDGLPLSLTTCVWH